MRELEGKNMMLQLEVSQLRSFLNTCYESSESVAGEVQRELLSASFLREEKKHLENLKFSVQGVQGFEKVVGFYSTMQALLGYLEQHTGHQVKDPSHSRKPSLGGQTLHDKMQVTQLSLGIQLGQG